MNSSGGTGLKVQTRADDVRLSKELRTEKLSIDPRPDHELLIDVGFLDLLLPVLDDDLPMRGHRGIDVNDPIPTLGARATFRA